MCLGGGGTKCARFLPFWFLVGGHSGEGTCNAVGFLPMLIYARIPRKIGIVKGLLHQRSKRYWWMDLCQKDGRWWLKWFQKLPRLVTQKLLQRHDKKLRTHLNLLTMEDNANWSETVSSGVNCLFSRNKTVVAKRMQFCIRLVNNVFYIFKWYFVKINKNLALKQATNNT